MANAPRFFKKCKPFTVCAGPARFSLPNHNNRCPSRSLPAQGGRLSAFSTDFILSCRTCGRALRSENLSLTPVSMHHFFRGRQRASLSQALQKIFSETGG